MSLPLFCVVVQMGVTYLTKIPVAIAMGREGHYDNRTPRDQQSRLTGWGRRALAAHQNGFEVFPIFAASVFVGHLSGGHGPWFSGLAITFVLSRLIYTALYLADRSTLRSLVWGVGMACCFGISIQGFGR